MYRQTALIINFDESLRPISGGYVVWENDVQVAIYAAEPALFDESLACIAVSLFEDLLDKHGAVERMF